MCSCPEGCRRNKGKKPHMTSMPSFNNFTFKSLLQEIPLLLCNLIYLVSVFRVHDSSTGLTSSADQFHYNFLSCDVLIVPK